MGDIIIIKSGEDLALTNSITIGSNIKTAVPGMIIYMKTLTGSKVI